MAPARSAACRASEGLFRTRYDTPALKGPASAQRAIGETGRTATVTASFASDHLFRGISQTRSRPAWQGTAEIEHSSGVYLGAFLSKLRCQGTDARQELDVSGGDRATLGGVKLDFGGIGHLYPGYTAPPGAASPVLDFAQIYLRGSTELGPVTLLGGFFHSPNFFGPSGSGHHLEGGADWKTGLWEVTLGGRIGCRATPSSARPTTCGGG